MTDAPPQIRTAPPRRLARAALDDYALVYGRSVHALDAELGATPAPPGLIDLTHGDTRAFTPPASALEDYAAGLEENTEAYTPYRGSARVRALLAPRLAALAGVPVDADRELVITPGSQGGLFAALSALVEEGDGVVLPDPDYFANERIVSYLGGRPLRLPLEQDDDGMLGFAGEDLESVAAAEPAVILASNPNNPTGGVYSAQATEALAETARRSGAYVVADQLYCRLLYRDTKLTQIGALPGMAERTVTLVGPSKTESMSGFRVGAAVGPAGLIDAMEQVLSLASIRTAGYSQQAMRHWLAGDDEWLAERIADHEALRDKLLARFRAMPGVRVRPPAGSSYVFPDVSGTALSLRLAGEGGRPGDDHAVAVALKRAGVLVNPGYQFGHRGRGSFRINFSQDARRLDDALDVIERTLADAG
jgi:aspartate/methionine/tyrosine aminotransferase